MARSANTAETREKLCADRPTWKTRIEKMAEVFAEWDLLPLEIRLDKALKAAGFRDLIAENDRLERQLTEVLAETVGWQKTAQTPAERAWANVHHADITRALARTRA